MGWFKFTNKKTGKVYDSREPVGTYLETEYGISKSNPLENKDIISKEPIYRYPNGKDYWIDDEKLAKVLECEVDEIPEVLSREF